MALLALFWSLSASVAAAGGRRGCWKQHSRRRVATRTAEEGWARLGATRGSTSCKSQQRIFRPEICLGLHAQFSPSSKAVLSMNLDGRW